MIRRLAAAATLLLLFCAASFAQSQPEVRLLELNNFHTDVELRYDCQRDDVYDKSLPAKTMTLEQTFHEILLVSGDGYIYHPRFLTFSGTVGLDLQQGTAQVKSPGQNANDTLNEVAPEFAIAGTLLPQHPVSLGFGFDKYTSTTNVPFNQVTTVDVDSQLVSLYLKSGPLPAEFSFSHDTNSQKQQGFGENRSEENTTFRAAVSNVTGPSTSSLTYEHLQNHENVEDVSTVTNEFTTIRRVNDVEFENALRFGTADWASLTSRAGYRDEEGTFPTSRATWDESLDLKHTENLSTQYGMDYSRTTIGSQVSEITALQANLTHQLFESLSSHARIYGSHQDLSGISTEDIYGFALQEDYRKHIPWGVLTAGVGGGYEITDDRTHPGLISILKESHALFDLTTTFLNNSNVVPGSVVVTDSTGLILYILNTDYELVPQGILTEIRRLPTGAIANGGSVLVSYQYQSGLPIRYGTRDLHGRIGLDLFNHLSLYASRLSLDRDAISGTDMGQLQSLEDTLLGAALRWGPATLTGEHEIYDSTLAPYTSDKVTLDVTWPVNDVHRIGATAAYRHVRFDTGVPLTLRQVGLTYQGAPKNWPSIKATAGYQWTDDRGLNTEYFYGSIALEYRIRDTVFSLQYQFNQQNDSVQKDVSQYAFFSIRRRLF